jgi:hypothetical protein
MTYLLHSGGQTVFLDKYHLHHARTIVRIYEGHRASCQKKTKAQMSLFTCHFFLFLRVYFELGSQNYRYRRNI